MKAKGVTPRNMIDDKEKIGICLDSIFQNDPFYKRLFSSKENFWIIDKDNNIRFGPFTKDEFEKERITREIKLELSEK